MTLDRGMEFADFEKVVQATGAVFCFALPRHPWRRGGNGNTDGLIRECFPKGAGFTAVGEQEVRAVYDAIVTDHANAMDTGHPGKSTIQRCCTCSDDSSLHRIISKRKNCHFFK